MNQTLILLSNIFCLQLTLELNDNIPILIEYSTHGHQTQIVLPVQLKVRFKPEDTEEFSLLHQNIPNP